MNNCVYDMWKYLDYDPMRDFLRYPHYFIGNLEYIPSYLLYALKDRLQLYLEWIKYAGTLFQYHYWEHKLNEIKKEIKIREEINNYGKIYGSRFVYQTLKRFQDGHLHFTI